MPDLRIDLEGLRDLGTDLGVVAREFGEANVSSDAVAEATGHPGLAEAVRSFAHGWDDKREDMVAGIEALGEGARAIADAFTDIDNEYAASLTEGAS
ncbi:hypothetical protein [Georgenia wangjunii]|uniref:hypothetical protein n=1 Tax=Georgenia wangjunii TaxID=3117730 RepID=UPI002F26CC59